MHALIKISTGVMLELYYVGLTEQVQNYIT